MRKISLYPRLAILNIKSNRQFYLPYILTCIATIAMFYIMTFLTFSDGTLSLQGGDILFFILKLGMIIIGLFSAIFLTYTNSFLMKRRKKELGLYNILGMGKGNIAVVLFFETMFVAVGTIVLGLALGILLSKLVLLLLYKIVRFPVPFGFEVSLEGLTYSVCVFGAVFTLILIFNLISIRHASPIELLHGSNVGEKEPKVKWAAAFLGVLSLSGGYYIALATENPLQAIMLFFVAVLLVIIGTYLLFTASSIAILKRLKAKPGYYYQPRHFIPVSGMLYRMKQNAVGLANICILSTMVLVMVSGTVCLYLGTEDSLFAGYPNDFSVNVRAPEGNARENLRGLIEQTIAEEGYTGENTQDYISLSTQTYRDGNNLCLSPDYGYNINNSAIISIMSQSEYEHFSGESVALASCEALLYSSIDNFGSEINLDGSRFEIVGDMNAPSLAASPSISTIIDSFCMVVSNESFEMLKEKYNDVTESWYYGFDIAAGSEEKLSFYDVLTNAPVSFPSDSLDGGYVSLSTSCREAERSFIYSMNGGFLFLGMFLGLVFLMATVLIIYYKQLSEGYEDKQRFEIMQKVGLGKDEIKEAVRSQILVVFFLPLGMAVIHIAFAFKMITKLLLLMNLTNVSLFAVCVVCTVAVFAIIYGIVYTLTAKTYYRIVE